MTDPLRPRDKDEPRRAIPLRPDKPGSGGRKADRGEEPLASTDDGRVKDADDKAIERESNALDNVREGYR